MRTLRVLLLSLALIAAAPASFTPYLVKDITPTLASGNSYPSQFVEVGDLVLFQVRKFGHSELWRSDGTASGTYRLGSGSFFEVAGDRCFFKVQPAHGGYELWITDGTLPGTFSLSEMSDYMEPGSAVWVPQQGVLYFGSAIRDQGHGRELWRSDGTPGGTYEVLDIAPGPDSSDPSYLTSFRGRVYFAAKSALWQSDGTAAGTVKVRDVPVKSLHVAGSRLVFVGADSQGSELWASDGTTAGTHRIADLTVGLASTSFQNFQVVGKRLFFSAAAGARGWQLYVTDGTSPGTHRLTRFSYEYALGREYYLAPLGDRLLFWAFDWDHGEELWSSDGTPQGTHTVPGACPDFVSCSESPLLRHRGRLYYGVNGPESPELWVTDGTAQGTRKVKDIPDGGRSWPEILGTAGGRLFFVTNEWDWSSTGIWTTDGTADGTVELAKFYDENLTIEGGAVGGGVVFSGEDHDHGIELWRSDGTPAGTHLLADIADEDVGGSHPSDPMTLGNRVLFFARDGHGGALWRSDGTEAGTAAVKRGLYEQTGWTASATRVFFTTYARHGLSELWTSDGSETGTIRVTPDSVSSVGELSAPVAKLGSRVFFSARDHRHGAEPWITDGTQAGTRLVADLNPGPDPSSPYDFAVFAGKAWFAASLHLWKSDGTAKGTIALGPELQEIQLWTTYGGRLWFTGRNSAGSVELWGTDGTAANTARLAEEQVIASLTVHAGRLWFLGNETELWSTDGTPAGTRRLGLPVSSDQPFKALLSDSVRLYLSGAQPGLWVSDGTARGTRKISDQGIAHDGIWITLAGRLFYTRYEGETLYTSDGTEAGTGPVRPDGQPRASRLLRFGNGVVAVTRGGQLWVSDGMAAGTKLIRDLSPIDYDYDTGNVLKAGPRLFFPAWDEETGWELWAMRE